MGGDDYVIDDNGAWGTRSDALIWYRQEVKRLKAALEAGGIPLKQPAVKEQALDPTINTDAGRCRANGWQAGDTLEGDEGDGPTRILITAIGEKRILAREISHAGKPCDEERELMWTLRCRDWKKI